MLQSSLHTPHVFDDNFAATEAILIILGALERADQGAFSARKIFKKRTSTREVTAPNVGPVGQANLLFRKHRNPYNDAVWVTFAEISTQYNDTIVPTTTLYHTIPGGSIGNSPKYHRYRASTLLVVI